MEDKREQEELLKKIDEYKRLAEEALEDLDEVIGVLSEELEDLGEDELTEDDYLDDGADWIIIF